MNLISFLHILGSASEPVSVITIYQDLRVKEPMKITAGLEHLANISLSLNTGMCDQEESLQGFISTWFHNLFCIFVQLSMYTQ